MSSIDEDSIIKLLDFNFIAFKIDKFLWVGKCPIVCLKIQISKIKLESTKCDSQSPTLNFILSEENLERAEYFKGKELLEAEIAGLNTELGYIQDVIESLNNSNMLSTEIIVSNPLFNLKWKSLYQEGRLEVRPNNKIQIISLSFIIGFIFSLVIIFLQNIIRNIYQK